MPRGRPSRAEAPATCRVEFRLSPDELKEFQRDVTEQGLTVAEYCRLAVLLLGDELREKRSVRNVGR